VGTVFKKTVTKAKPAGAEVFTLKGERWARWKDAKGKLHKAKLTTGEQGQERIVFDAKTFFAKYRDGAGIVRTVATGCRDEQAARSVLADLERRAELVKAGVMTPTEDRIADHQGDALAGHFDAYENYLRSKGVCKVHRENTRRFLDRLANECALRRLLDLKRETLEKWLAQKSSAGMSARSRNSYQGALVSFCNWCVENGRLALNPYRAMPKANEKADRRRQRRAMAEGELVQLLDVARRRPLADAQLVRRGKSKGQFIAKLRADIIEKLTRLGWERSLIYKTLILTGLRKNELTSLTVCQLYLDAKLPYIDLKAADEKNRQGNSIMLRADLAEDLRQWLAAELVRLQTEAREQGEPIPARLPTEIPLFNVPAGLLRILNLDLKAAGIAKRDERGRTLDVHALRTTFGTLLSKGGVAPRTAQAAMRHASLDMTMQTYTDPKLLDIAGALDALPCLPLHAGQESIADAAKATGTDDIGRSQFAPEFAPATDKSGQKPSLAVIMAHDDKSIGKPHGIDATSCVDKRKDPLTIVVNGSEEWSRRGSNPQPLECHRPK
jgi:integrase